MHMMWFTERAYHYDPEVEPEKYHALENQILKIRSFFGTPNRFFDAEHGARLLNQYLDEKVYTDQELLNFDGVMLNEHHGTPFCMGAVMDVEAAALAAKTKRVKIVLLGNPAATVANQLRLAEELAMIDLISGGRLVSGWVRGAGSEQFANNTNPALNRELFEEAVDFIDKAWTTPGPFRYEGKRLHFRHVNPWVLPLQKPRPPFWIPGLDQPRHSGMVRAPPLPVRRAGDEARTHHGPLGNLRQGGGAGGLSGGPPGEFRLLAAGDDR